VLLSALLKTSVIMFTAAAVVEQVGLCAAEMSGVGESTMSRRKSFKKSLRESFRRLRSRRSDRRRKTTAHDDDSRQTYVHQSQRLTVRDGVRLVVNCCCRSSAFMGDRETTDSWNNIWSLDKAQTLVVRLV